MMAALATMVMSLGELLGPTAGDLAALEIRDLVADSRQVSPGAAFVAVPGGRSHGPSHSNRHRHIYSHRYGYSHRQGYSHSHDQR